MATKRGSSGFNYRNSGNGRYMSQRQAENKPRETWEKERKPPPSKTRPK